MVKVKIPQIACQKVLNSVRVYAVIISKYATKIVGMQKRRVACIHGTKDQKQSTFNTFNSACTNFLKQEVMTSTL